MLNSCKKYEEDKFISTYTVKSRLVKNGVWNITEIEDLETGKKLSPDFHVSDYIQFKSDGNYKVNGYGYDQVFSDILKPVFISQLQNENDYIYIGYNYTNYKFENNKENLNLCGFISFGTKSIYNVFDIYKTINLNCKILRLQYINMTLLYNDRLVIRLKKVILK
jgi:hypothetical protein